MGLKSKTEVVSDQTDRSKPLRPVKLEKKLLFCPKSAILTAMSVRPFVVGMCTRNRCHTFEPPTYTEIWTTPNMVEDSTAGEGVTDDDGIASAAEEERPPPQALMCDTLNVTASRLFFPKAFSLCCLKAVGILLCWCCENN